MSNVKFYAILSFITSMLASALVYGQGIDPVRDLPKVDLSVTKESDKPTFELHGDFALWYYRPNQSWVDENFSIYTLNVLADSTFENYGVHSEIRFSDIWFRTYYLSNVWFQEIYGYFHDPASNYIIKVGKEYTHFGKFWDGTYYGNILYFDGITLSPDDGISLEGTLPNLHGWNLDYYFQYFVIDGGTNGSLTADGQKGEGGPGGVETGSGAPIGNLDPSNVTGRDLISNVGSHKRNDFIARLEPSVPLFTGKLTLGLNYQYMLVDIVDGIDDTDPTAPLTYFNARRLDVHRQGVDLSYTVGPFTIFGEWIHQHGQTSIDFPYPKTGATKVDYYWAGVSYKHGKFTYYYNYSEGQYYDLSNNGVDVADAGIHDILQVPGFSYEFKKYITVAGEYGYWYRTHSGNFSMNDNSVNLYLKASM